MSTPSIFGNSEPAKPLDRACFMEKPSQPTVILITALPTIALIQCKYLLTNISVYCSNTTYLNVVVEILRAHMYEGGCSEGQICDSCNYSSLNKNIDLRDFNANFTLFSTTLTMKNNVWCSLLHCVFRLITLISPSDDPNFILVHHLFKQVFYMC